MSTKNERVFHRTVASHGPQLALGAELEPHLAVLRCAAVVNRPSAPECLQRRVDQH